MCSSTVRPWGIALALALSVGIPATAQQSKNYRLTEHSLNAGGHPADGQVMASASFKVSYDAVGAPTVQSGMAAPSFRMDTSFGAAYPPPGEVTGLHFAGDDLLSWNAERSAGVYGVYRDLVSQLPGLEYGVCLRGALAQTSLTDTSTPPLGRAYFYLVTARNRLGEEGTKGHDSVGNERANDAPCP
jgi:hypothetical protein